MQKQWVESASLFMDFVSSRHGQSVKASLEAGELVATEVDKKCLKKFDAEEAEKNYLLGLKHWEKKMCKQTEENHNKHSVAIHQRSSAAHGALHSICDLSLRNKLEAEPEYQDIVKDKQCCAMKLLGLVQKIMNGSTYVVVDDAVGSLVESLHNVLLIRGDDFDSLPKYLEASEHRHAALDGDGFEVASQSFVMHAWRNW